MDKTPVTVIGGGLAGCEAAYKLAKAGIPVRLIEMRPEKLTPAHRTGLLAELVCSNSLKSQDPATAQGLLKKEMSLLGSLILECAQMSRVGAGTALAVDRELLGSLVTERLVSHPLIEIVREEAREIPREGAAVVATGPLTSDELARDLQRLTGEDYLYFFDAVAPVVAADSIDYEKAYRASRYEKGEADYINCPLSEGEYRHFYSQLLEADTVPLEAADAGVYFSGCMPVEAMARKGEDTLRFGPMRPVGLRDPRTGKTPFAVLQLRRENLDGTMYSLVGFQTRMRWGDQERVLRLIPALHDARFLRLGVMHRNTYINSPALLDGTLQFRSRPGLFFAGQLTGVEGYMESAATGIMAGINCALTVLGEKPLVLPEETMIGSLCRYISDLQRRNFQPMNANFGLLPALEEKIRGRRERCQALSERAVLSFEQFSEYCGNSIVKKFML